MKKELLILLLLFIIVNVCFKVFTDTNILLLQDILYPISFLGFIIGFTFSEGWFLGNIITTLILYGLYHLFKFIIFPTKPLDL